jgi:transcriptional regulator with XRE-family HTH domain
MAGTAANQNTGKRDDGDANKDELAARIGKTVRELRKTGKLSLKQLAEQTNLSVALLSRIENGLVTPSLGTLRAVGDYLKVDIGYFFRQGAEEGYVVTRKGKHPPIKSEKGHYEVEALAMGLENQFMDPVIVTTLAKGDEPVRLVEHEGQEFLYILEGKLELTIGEKKLVLNPGDAAYFRGEFPHGGKSLSKRPARSLHVHLIPGSRLGSFVK